MKLSDIQAIDGNDPLAGKKPLFELPEQTIYLDGNSLGPLTKAAKARAKAVVEQQWGEDLITSWNKHQWIDLPQRIGTKIGALIGAAEGQVICADSISINLFKLIATALSLNPKRSIVLAQKDSFPTDLYVAQGLTELLGQHRCELKLVSDEQLTDAIDEDVALVMLNHVNYKSGEIYPMEELTALAHEQGALTLWDIAHSAGAMKVELDRCKVDLAVGCSYKYLNGGPGAPAFVYVARRHQNKVEQPLSGWMGHASPFAFSGEYQGAEGVNRYLSGTPGILSMATLDAALSAFDGVNMLGVRQKSLGLSSVFLILMDKLGLEQEFELLSPQEHELRGSQLAFAHPDAYAICQALIARGVIGDFRAPDVLRFGFTPLYLSFEEIWHAVHILADIINTKAYTAEAFQTPQKVT